LSDAPVPPAPIAPVPEPPPDAAVPAPASASTGPAPLVAVLGEPALAVPGAVRALLDLGFRVRVLCADEMEDLAALSARPATHTGTGGVQPPTSGTTPEGARGVLEIVRGTPDTPKDLEKLCAGAAGLALLCPVNLNGRAWRPNTHVEDVKNGLAAAEAAQVKRVAYLSTLCANHESKVRCLREAGQAEKLIEKAHAKPYVFRAGPLAGRHDGLLSLLADEANDGRPWMWVWGYGGTLVQPIAPLDAGRCLARAFVEAAPGLQPGVYGVAGAEIVTLLELADRVLERKGRFKVKLHIPLFVLRLAKLAAGNNGKAGFGERVGLLFENFATDHNDAPLLLGPHAKLKDLQALQDEVLGTV